MSHVALAVSVGLAWFLLVGLGASVVAAALARATTQWAGGPSRASLWLGLRMFPTVAGLLFVVTFFVPAFERFEPAEAGEPVGLGLGVLVAAALAVIVRAALKGTAGWRRASRQARAWLRNSDELRCPGTTARVHCVRDRRPAVSLVGIFRPRLFVTRPVVDALTPEELLVVVAHELEHRSAWDNLKRLVMLAAPDVLGAVRTGALLEERWAHAAESEADRRAVGGDRGRGLALASALVKVARLMPAVSPLAVPVSGLYSGGPLARRVERLAGHDPEPARGRLLPWFVIGAAGVIGYCATSSTLLRAIHHVTEFLVSLAG